MQPDIVRPRAAVGEAGPGARQLVQEFHGIDHAGDASGEVIQTRFGVAGEWPAVVERETLIVEVHASHAVTVDQPGLAQVIVVKRVQPAARIEDVVISCDQRPFRQLAVLHHGVVLGMRAIVSAEPDFQTASLQPPQCGRWIAEPGAVVEPQDESLRAPVIAGDRLDRQMHQRGSRTVGGERDRQRKIADDRTAAPQVLPLHGQARGEARAIVGE